MKNLNIKNSYSNRGMSLESDINITNDYYLTNNIAIIHKKPTPIKATKVSYKKGKIINEGYFEVKSTTDYNGLYKGKYIDFEAKETNSKTSFPLSNIHTHQLEHMKKIIEHQGISFIIIRFSLLNETYLLENKQLFDFLENTERKSIPLEVIKKEGYLIKEQYNPRLDYIKIIDLLYFKGWYYERKVKKYIH